MDAEAGRSTEWHRGMGARGPLRHVRTGREISRRAAMMSVRLPLSPRHVEDPLWERVIGLCCSPLKSAGTFPGGIGSSSPLGWHRDKGFEKINRARHCP